MRYKKLAIHSVPRSGSSWLGQLINSSPHVMYKYQPLFSYALKGFLDERASYARIQLFFEQLQTTEDRFMDQVREIEAGKAPAFAKKDLRVVAYKEVRYHHILKNLLAQDPNIMVIGLVRNPLAVINSWLRAPREFRKDQGWSELEEWRWAYAKNEGKKEEFYGYEKWKEVALMFEQLQRDYPQRFRLLWYADLLNQTEAIVEQLFAMLELPLTEQTMSFIRESKSQTVDDPYAVYREKRTDDQWKKELPEIIQEAILTDLRNTSLEKYID